MEKDNIPNPELQLAHEFVRFTGNNIFLTGRAGTGKTTFLHTLKELSPKRMIVVAPTGVAAINAGGVTIHSFFQLPFSPRIPGYTESKDRKSLRFSSQKRNIIKSLDLLVIDEISMVRADLLDSIDERLRQFRRNDRPFGGVQLLMIGDMQQLPPVVKNNEWALLSKHYQTPFFFSSLALQKSGYITITLQHVYRQRDQHFIELLNKIRYKKMDIEAVKQLNERYKPNFDPGDENYIILTTHNAKAKAINDKKLDRLGGKRKRFSAAIEGHFPEYMFPTEPELELKAGAQVMFVKNDPDMEKRFFNGKIGHVTEIGETGVTVRCPGDDEPIRVGRLVWENIKYEIDEQTKEIKEKVEGTFTQLPLKPAWAITIHKSQGLTFDKAIIDSESAFAHGQVYVALSRCRSLEGLVLSTPFSPASMKPDSAIEAFNKTTDENQPDPQRLQIAKADYQLKLLLDLFAFDELFKAANWLLRLLEENAGSLQPDASSPLKNMHAKLKEKVLAVSGKFERQIRSLLQENEDAEKNELLRERVGKATVYFSEQLQSIVLEPLKGFSIETDNKEVVKKIVRAEKRLLDEAGFKQLCLTSCRQGFSVRDYLAARAKATLESEGTKPPKPKKKQPVGKGISNPGLYALLKTWRDAKATELGLPHYMVLSLKSMRALSNQAPADMDQLKTVHGFGRKKLENFGEELLELIDDYRAENEVKVTPLPQVFVLEKKPKVNTKQISKELWLQHKDLQKVAEERELAVSTVSGHLAHFVGTGELPVTDFVSGEKMKTIVLFFKRNSKLTLTEARNQLGEAYSYTDLRFVQQHLNSQAAKAE